MSSHVPAVDIRGLVKVFSLLGFVEEFQILHRLHSKYCTASRDKKIIITIGVIIGL